MLTSPEECSMVVYENSKSGRTKGRGLLSSYTHWTGYCVRGGDRDNNSRPVPHDGLRVAVRRPGTVPCDGSVL